ncbi:MAG: AbrB/MazE/SpoVT family DNA-binding domain-containing protein [Thermodesulfovibrionia bacterium]
MQRKICSIGNSQGVSIPTEMLEKLKLSKGSEVDIKVDEKNTRILIEPVTEKRSPKGINREFVSQVNDFIEKYRLALKELAKK